MPRQAVSTSGAPAAIGPYSQAIAVDDFLFCSGSLGMDPATGQLADGIEAQTERAFQNLESVLEANGLSMGDVVKTTVFLADLNDFSAMNGVYARHAIDPAPARSTVEVAGLPRGALVEIEAIAHRS